MLQKELTKYELSRFKKNSVCKICGNPIASSESFEMIKHKSGKCINYAFIHTACIFQPKRTFNFGDILNQVYVDREEISSLVN